MAIEVKKLEKSVVEFEVNVGADVFRKDLESSCRNFSKNKNFKGFRKGKVPPRIIERMYGKDSFYEDALIIALERAYKAAMSELNFEVIGKPRVAVEGIDEEEGITAVISVDVYPEVKLCDYEKIELKKEDTDRVAVTDEDVDKKINDLRSQEAILVTVEDRCVEDGDVIILRPENNDEIASILPGTLPDTLTFEVDIKGNYIDASEKLIGKKVGDSVKVPLRIPSSYAIESLRGTLIKRSCVIEMIQVKELPELDEEFVSQMSDEAKTVDEFRNEVRMEIEEYNKRQGRNELYRKIKGTIIDGSDVDIPEAMVYEFAERFLGKNYMRPEDNQRLHKDILRKFIKEYLVISAIAERENIEISDEDVEAHENSYAYHDEYEEDDADRFTLLNNKVLGFLSERVVFV